MSRYSELGFVNIAPDELPNAMESATKRRFIVDGYGPLTISGEPRFGRILFAHGAGAGHLSDFMRQFVATLAGGGLQVLAIDFPYMQHAYELGKRRPPPPAGHTLAHFGRWYQLLCPFGASPLWVGGKSMGGRIASMFASNALTSEATSHEKGCPGLVVAGYPFHPPRQPHKLRVAHFASVSCPALILQGERDPFGNIEEVSGYALPPTTQLKWLQDGDHDFKPRRSSGLKHTVLIDDAAIYAASFVRAHHTVAAG
ncbi:dienelactone hydrolase [Vreelandella venusta]|uniref:alpha/beta family hydrolase n=1 Tax=Vreelandella venusta TaxID=44935 RepID=UPI0038512E3F